MADPFAEFGEPVDEAALQAAPPRREPIGRAAAAGLGALETLSAGFAPKMHGLAKSLTGDEGVRLGPAFQPEPGDTPEIAALKQQALAQQAAQPSDYEINKRAYQGLTQRAEKQQPGAFLGGQLGTGAVQALAGGALAPARAAAIAVPSLLQRLGMGQAGARIGIGAGEGALQGGLAGAGHSQGDVTTKSGAGQLLKDILTGGSVGFGLGAGLPAAGAGLRRGGRAVTEFAREQAPEQALKAAGAIGKDFKALRDEAVDYGRFLLENRLIPRGGSKGDIAQRLEGLQRGSGADIGEQLGNIQEQPNVMRLLERIQGRMQGLEPTERRLQGGEIEALMGDVGEKFGVRPVQLPEGATGPEQMLPTQNLTAQELNRLKSAIDARVKWRPTSAGEAEQSQARRLVANEARGELHDAAARGLQPGQLATFRRAMADYGPASDLLAIAQEGAAREGGNTMLGLVGPILAGAAGVGTGSAAGAGAGVASALGTALAWKLLKERGPAFAARALEDVANAGERLNPARLPPSVLRALVTSRGLAAPAERALAPAALPQRSFAPLEDYLAEER